MLLFPEGKILSGTFYLDIYNAELTGHLKTDKGDLTFHAYTPQPEEVNIVEVSSGVPYRWKGIPGNPCSPRIRVFPHLKEKLKYKDNPAPVVDQKDKEGSWVQSLLAGGDYATYWKEVPGGKSRSVLYVSTANEVPASSLSLAKAMKTVEATQITGTKLLKQRHASGGMPTTNVLSFPFRTKNWRTFISYRCTNLPLVLIRMARQWT